MFVSLRWILILRLRYILLPRELGFNEMATDCSLMHIQYTSDMITSHFPFFPHSDARFHYFRWSRTWTCMRTRRPIPKSRFAFLPIPLKPLIYSRHTNIILLGYGYLRLLIGQHRINLDLTTGYR